MHTLFYFLFFEITLAFEKYKNKMNKETNKFPKASRKENAIFSKKKKPKKEKKTLRTKSLFSHLLKFKLSENDFS